MSYRGKEGWKEGSKITTELGLKKHQMKADKEKDSRLRKWHFRGLSWGRGLLNKMWNLEGSSSSSSPTEKI